MSAPEVSVPLVPGDPYPVDGLCPRCLLPSLVHVELYALADSGVTPVGSWSGCAEDNCDEGVEP